MSWKAAFLTVVWTHESEVPVDAGTAFQARAAATGNARSPSVLRRVTRVVGTSSIDADPERKRRRDSIPDGRWSVSAWYDGAMPWK